MNSLSFENMNNEPIFNARLLSDLSKTVKDAAIKIPDEFIPTDDNRSTLKHDDWANVDLPVIDFVADGSDDVLSLARRIVGAAAEWGFFVIRNHGVPTEVIQEVQAQGRKLFALPLEQKDKTTLPELMGYRGDHRGVGLEKLMWSEAFMVSCHPQSAMVEDLAERVWPEGKVEFCTALRNYWAAVKKLQLHILCLMALGLGLEEDFFTKHFTTKAMSNDLFRYNHYPTCPRPSEVLGSHGHTDTGVLTILHDGGLGGLQVCKDGQWMGVRPVEGALICQCGDFLQVWTNDILKASLHRVVVNEKEDRLSLASFTYPGDQTTLSAPSALVEDCKRPRLYKAFKYQDYLAHFRNTIISEGRFPAGMDIVNANFKNEVQC